MGSETVTKVAEPKANEAESNRDRVRRLLFAPLGFRFARGADEEAGRRSLDALADELAYMRDESLVTLAAMLRSKGQGAARCFWPDPATFRGFSELVEPRPVATIPALRRWFGSIEGPKAQADGTLVETFDYFEAHKAPPVSEGARRWVLAQAQANSRRLEIVERRRADGVPIAPEEAAWARWYRERRAYIDELVRIEQEAKGRVE